jgi:hypothetical protein
MNHRPSGLKFFHSPVKGTFLGAFALSALVFFSSMSVYISNNYEDDYLRMVSNTYSNFDGLALGLFTPLWIGLTSALLVKFCILISDSFAELVVAKISAVLGIVLLYLLITFLGTMGILYIS